MSGLRVIPARSRTPSVTVVITLIRKGRVVIWRLTRWLFFPLSAVPLLSGTNFRQGEGSGDSKLRQVNKVHGVVITTREPPCHYFT